MMYNMNYKLLLFTYQLSKLFFLIYVYYVRLPYLTRRSSVDRIDSERVSFFKSLRSIFFFIVFSLVLWFDWYRGLWVRLRRWIEPVFFRNFCFIEIDDLMIFVLSKSYEYFRDVLLLGEQGRIGFWNNTVNGAAKELVVCSLRNAWGLYWMHHATYEVWFWVNGFCILWSVSMVYSLGKRYVYTLFHHFERRSPLKDRGLKEAVQKLLRENGYPVKEVLVAHQFPNDFLIKNEVVGFEFSTDGGVISLRSSLVEKCTEQEILALLVHEIGLWKQGSLIVQFCGCTAFIVLKINLLFCLSNCTSLQKAFGVSKSCVGLNFIMLEHFSNSLRFPIEIACRYIVRNMETKADKFAVAKGYKRDLLAAMRLLTFEKLLPLKSVVDLCFVPGYFSSFRLYELNALPEKAVTVEEEGDGRTGDGSMAKLE